MTAKVAKLKKASTAAPAILKKKAAVKKIDKELAALHDQIEERSLARDAAIKELHNKELEDLDENAEYFTKRYSQEYDLLQTAKSVMDHHKTKFAEAKKVKSRIVERICNLNDEIEESKQPIIKLSKTMNDEAWKNGETKLLTHFGLADSIIVMLESEGFTSIGKLMDDESWKDIPGLGDATAEKILNSCSDMIDNFNEQVKKIKEEAGVKDEPVTEESGEEE